MTGSGILHKRKIAQAAGRKEINISQTHRFMIKCIHSVLKSISIVKNWRTWRLAVCSRVHMIETNNSIIPMHNVCFACLLAEFAFSAYTAFISVLFHSMLFPRAQKLSSADAWGKQRLMVTSPGVSKVSMLVYPSMAALTLVCGQMNVRFWSKCRIRNKAQTKGVYQPTNLNMYCTKNKCINSAWSMQDEIPDPQPYLVTPVLCDERRTFPPYTGAFEKPGPAIAWLRRWCVAAVEGLNPLCCKLAGLNAWENAMTWAEHSRLSIINLSIIYSNSSTRTGKDLSRRSCPLWALALDVFSTLTQTQTYLRLRLGLGIPMYSI
jgi:hypothetical protein